MIVFGIHCNFIIAFSKGKYVHPKNWARLRGFASPSTPDQASGAQFVQACSLTTPITKFLFSLHYNDN